MYKQVQQDKNHFIFQKDYMMSFIHLTFQIVPILTPKDYDTYYNNTILYFDNDSKELYEYAEQIQYQISHNIYAFNCSIDQTFCKQKHISIPQIGVRYRNITLFSLDKITSAQQMLAIIQQLEADQIQEKAIESDCFSDYQKVDNWFMMHGPDKELFLDSMEIFKGKVVGCYIYSEQNKLQAIHRVGKEQIIIDFTQTFTKQYIENFAERNQFSIFGKYQQSLLQRIFPQYKLGLFVFNPKDEEQKQYAKQFRNIIVDIIKDQEQIATDIVYAQTPFSNKELQQFFTNIQLQTDKPQFIVFTPQQFIVYQQDLMNKLEFRAFLDDVRSGHINMVNQQQKQNNENKIDESINQQELKDEL